MLFQSVLHHPTLTYYCDIQKLSPCFAHNSYYDGLFLLMHTTIIKHATHIYPTILLMNESELKIMRHQYCQWGQELKFQDYPGHS